MGNKYKIFLNEAEKVAFNIQHRKTINFNISKYDTAVEKGKTQYSNLELAKQRASYIKSKTINNLDKYLLQFEENFTKRGGKVIWAKDEKQAINKVLSILQSINAKSIVKSKSMTTEEIEFNQALEENGIQSIETDLGEYIVQLADEKPYHIVTPAMHKSKEDVAELFNKKFNTPENSSPEYITNFVRKLLRKKYTSADAGITGGNFLIADIGGVAVTENEGNALMSTSFPKVHIAIVGIEKIIPSITDFNLFWPLLACHGTGQKITAYNTIFTGPKQSGEIDGPEEMYVILLDNGRTNLLSQTRQYKALSCIRCGACLNACPVYKNIGGYTYASTYSGPIGSVITPHFKEMKDFKHLSFASSLCGKCTEVCPVKIDLHKLLLYNRHNSVKNGYTNFIERTSMYGFKKLMLNRKLLDFAGGRTKNLAINSFFKGAWGPRRELPVIAKKSFSKLWKNNRT